MVLSVSQGVPCDRLYLIVSTLCSHMKLVFSKNEVYHNTKISVYPDGSYKCISCTKPIFKDKSFELVNKKNCIKPQKYNTESTPRSDSLKRAKDSIFDIVKLNNFKYFCTLTLDASKVSSRYDKESVKKILLNWLKNMSHRHNLSYLLIVEYHKDGAIHMHMLCSGNLSLTDSGHKDNKNRTIYNINNWHYGWSTAIEITGEKDHVAKYVTKYITKDSNKIFGKYYYSSSDLKRKPPTHLVDVDYSNLPNKEYSIENAGIRFKYPLIDDVKEHIIYD